MQDQLNTVKYCSVPASACLFQCSSISISLFQCSSISMSVSVFQHQHVCFSVPASASVCFSVPASACLFQWQFSKSVCVNWFLPVFFFGRRSLLRLWELWRNIVISTSVCLFVCLSVCLSASIYVELHAQSLSDFL